MEAITKGKEEILEKYESSTLFPYYQRLQGTNHREIQNMLRNQILSKISTIDQYNPIKQLLENIIVLDTIKTKEILPGTEDILRKFDIRLPSDL
jgi:hypothetical protein